MTIHKVTSQRIVTEEKVLSVVCDMCGHEHRPPGHISAHRGEVNWSTEGGYHQDEVCIQRTTGYNYPEGDGRDVQFFHCCPKCWEEKIVPLFPVPPHEEATDPV